MSAHPIGSATLSFGLVSVPIKLFSTGESSAAISFNWLHKKDGARLKQQYVCSKDGDKVEKDDMVKGYEFTKGQYVIFKPEELKGLPADYIEAHNHLGMALHATGNTERFEQVVMHLLRFDPKMTRRLIVDTGRSDLAHLVQHLVV